MGRGGQNQTHAQLEGMLKLDSFRVGNVSGRATIRWGSGDSIRAEAGPDTVRLLYRYRGQEVRERVMISRVPNHYGGARPFFLCPGCGRRVRYLYLRWGRFRCRSCSRLNYASQQATKDVLVPYRAAAKLLRERFQVPRERIPVPMKLPCFFPDKPKWMRWATYWALMEQYRKLQRDYVSAFVSHAVADLERLRR